MAWLYSKPSLLFDISSCHIYLNYPMMIKQAGLPQEQYVKIVSFFLSGISWETRSNHEKLSTEDSKHYLQEVFFSLIEGRQMDWFPLMAKVCFSFLKKKPYTYKLLISHMWCISSKMSELENKIKTQFIVCLKFRALSCCKPYQNLA